MPVGGESDGKANSGELPIYQFDTAEAADTERREDFDIGQAKVLEIAVVLAADEGRARKRQAGFGVIERRRVRYFFRA